MSEGDFFSEQAKRATAAAVRSAEQQTSAEIVVAVRKSSGRYGVLAYHFGLGLAAIVVAYLLLTPTVFSPFAITLDGIAAFAVGCLLAANFDTLRRWFSRSATLEGNVNSSARAAFFDLGISRTSGRNGLLVYASMFERRCVVLTDIGLNPAQLGARWLDSERDLAEAVKRRDLAAFQRAVAALGAALCDDHPRSERDLNELADEVQ